MTVAVICVGLLGALVFGLGFGVSMMRARTDTVVGHSSDPRDPLHKVVRAHGNTCEYAPMLAVLMLILGLLDPATWVLWVMGAVTLCRYLIVAGLLASPTLERPHPLRFVGALGTYVLGLALCLALVLEYRGPIAA